LVGRRAFSARNSVSMVASLASVSAISLAAFA
jgi:hypothetical protein